jgi:hypothetical protein
MSHPHDDFGNEEPEYDGKANWRNAQRVAAAFFEWLYHSSVAEEADVDLNSTERERVHELFVTYAEAMVPGFRGQKNSQRNRLESLVMAALKKQKRVKMKRYNDGVVMCSFARYDGSFAPYQDRVTARDKAKQQREALQASKGGIVVASEPVLTPYESILPVNADVTVEFLIDAMDSPMELFNVTITGPKRNSFRLATELPLQIEDSEDPVSMRLSLRTTSAGVYRADVVMYFRPSSDTFNVDDAEEAETFPILRSLSLNAAVDPVMMQMLQPVTPYQKKKKRPHKDERPIDKKNVFYPPRATSGSDIAAAAKYNRLNQYKIPVDVRETASNKEDVEATLEPPTQDTPENELHEVYQTFWQQMLWLSELQTYEDIKLFDIENAVLKKHGRLLKLSVPGLAEGRPSVLRGDTVLCNWMGKQYRGRVESVQLLDVLLQFHNSFHRLFNVNLDRVELVRFTFSRTTFRTSHRGCQLAPSVLRPAMLMPKPLHVSRILDNNHQRTPRMVPEIFSWASHSLNEEQKAAVTRIATGKLRPLPYVIFGPPGTG